MNVALAIAVCVVFVVLALWHFRMAAAPAPGVSGAVPSVEGKPLFVPSSRATVGVGIALLSFAVLQPAAVAAPIASGCACLALVRPRSWSLRTRHRRVQVRRILQACSWQSFRKARHADLLAVVSAFGCWCGSRRPSQWRLMGSPSPHTTRRAVLAPGGSTTCRTRFIFRCSPALSSTAPVC